MRNIPWVDDSPVTEVSGELEINGVAVQATSLSVSRSIPSNLPAQVAGVGGYTAATGSVSVEPHGASVTSRSPTPWGAETPQPLAPVKASAVVDGQRVKMFEGLVDKVSGKLSDTGVDVGLVDATDRLNRQVSVQPMCRIMPAPTTDGSTNDLNCDLFSTYLVDKVLRQCGFHATPPAMGYCYMSAPLMGSAWPERGKLVISGRDGSHKLSPWWGTTPWGMAAHKLTASYEPDTAWGGRDGSMSWPLEVILMNGGTQFQASRISMLWPNGRGLSVAVSSVGTIRADARFSPGPEWTTLTGALPTTFGAWRTASVRFTPRGNMRMDIQIRTNNGGVWNRLDAAIPYGTDTLSMSEVRLDIPEGSIGGVQIGSPGNPSGAERYKRSAVLTPPVPMVPLTGSPAITNENALDLLTSWAEAECAAMWIDEDGVFQWRNRERIVSGAPVADLTSTSDLLDLSWSHDIQGAAARAVVEYKRFGVQRSRRSRIQVWQGSGQTMEPGDVFEEFATCPDDEVWINVDGTPDIFQAETSKTAFNRGRGSWMGYTAYDEDGDEHGNGEYVGYEASIGYVSRTTYKLTQSWLGKVPTGVVSIKTQTRDGGGFLKPQWQGFNLPVLRAQCRLTMADARQVGTAGGPADAPDLTHDVGWWVQDETAVRSLAYWLAQQTAKPRPVVDGVPIVADPRLQIGDRVTVSDTHKSGLRITGTIIGLSSDLAAGDYGMELRLLVTQVVPIEPTLFDYDAAWGSADLAARDALWGGATLAAFDADPLRRN